MDFELQKEDLNSNARAGLITTAHGTIDPDFHACWHSGFGQGCAFPRT